MQLSIYDIEALLTHEDIEGFIEAGVPVDEYALEAQAIARALTEIPVGEETEEAVLVVVTALWANAFGLSREDIKLRLPALKRVVGEMMKA